MLIPIWVEVDYRAKRKLITGEEAEQLGILQKELSGFQVVK